ncbi:hypothetical protein [Leucobacter celer]|uniref:hypothetical protein n=1 Tax=Leucobacter celer TaxID=668625 RepID=UPI0006A7CF52|nr:hypothetical protein [Leucobacter celer]
MTAAETPKGADDTDDALPHHAASERAGHWEKEVARSGHDYQPTPATVARRAAEVRRNAETLKGEGTRPREETPGDEGQE